MAWQQFPHPISLTWTYGTSKPYTGTTARGAGGRNQGMSAFGCESIIWNGLEWMLPTGWLFDHIKPWAMYAVPIAPRPNPRQGMLGTLWLQIRNSVQELVHLHFFLKAPDLDRHWYVWYYSTMNYIVPPVPSFRLRATIPEPFPDFSLILLNSEGPEPPLHVFT